MDDELIKCDFCNQGEVTTRFPCPSFDLAVVLQDKETGEVEVANEVIGMQGDWLACDRCADLVIRNEKAALVDIGLDSVEMAQGHPIRVEIRESMREGMEQIHAVFFGKWDGRNVPV